MQTFAALKFYPEKKEAGVTYNEVLKTNAMGQNVIQFGFQMTRLESKASGFQETLSPYIAISVTSLFTRHI